MTEVGNMSQTFNWLYNRKTINTVLSTTVVSQQRILKIFGLIVAMLLREIRNSLCIGWGWSLSVQILCVCLREFSNCESNLSVTKSHFKCFWNVWHFICSQAGFAWLSSIIPCLFRTSWLRKRGVLSAAPASGGWMRNTLNHQLTLVVHC